METLESPWQGAWNLLLFEIANKEEFSGRKEEQLNSWLCGGGEVEGKPGWTSAARLWTLGRKKQSEWILRHGGGGGKDHVGHSANLQRRADSFTETGYSGEA